MKIITSKAETRKIHEKSCYDGLLDWPFILYRTLLCNNSRPRIASPGGQSDSSLLMEILVYINGYDNDDDRQIIYSEADKGDRL